jgi:hypothetical protein
MAQRVIHTNGYSGKKIDQSRENTTKGDERNILVASNDISSNEFSNKINVLSSTISNTITNTNIKNKKNVNVTDERNYINLKSSKIPTASNIFNKFYTSKIYTYIDVLDTYRSVIYYHSAFIFVMIVIYSMLFSGVENIYKWAMSLTFVFTIIYSVISGIYVEKLLSAWDSTIRNGLIKFWNLCTSFSIKNYRLLREYREVYQYHYKDVFSRVPNTNVNESRKIINDEETKAYIDYILQNDVSERMESYDWMKSSIEKINQYIRMCYYLSFIGPTDSLDISGGNLFVNIKSESISNKRNRKLESILNTIKTEYRDELVETWTSIDKNNSDGMLVLIPCKWIVYEYRNIFRYLNCAKYFKNIYSSFANDYNDLENTTYELCSTIQELFRRKTINIPHVFLRFYHVLTEGMILCLDNFIALNIVTCFFANGSLFIPIIMSIMFHLISICIIYYIIGITDELSKPIKSNSEIENFDEQIETIFNEMRVLIVEGKGRNKLI